MIKEKLTSAIEQVVVYWKKPPAGRFMPFKEIAALSVGGMGSKFIIHTVSLMILSVGNALIGNNIGIPPTEMYIIYLLSVLSGFPFLPLKAKMMDNSRSKKGRYRPYILSMGLPTAILGIGFVLMPYDRMSLFWKCVVVLLFNVGFQFFYNFFYEIDTNFINLLSPNTYERSDVVSIKSVTDSFAPTIMNLLMPLFARLITGENTLVDMRIYKVTYPPILILGFFLSLLAYFHTEEKIVEPKTHKVKINFVRSLKSVLRNKYFWIISIAGLSAFLENAVYDVMNWLYSYQDACSAGEFSLIITIRGNASLWPMLIIPFLVRFVGKKTLMVVSNIINVIFIFLMYPIIKYGDLSEIMWWLLVCFFFNYAAAFATTLLTPSLNGDVRDYQQYLTGERVDGVFVAVSSIGAIVTLATSSIIPSIYEKTGLNEETAIALGYDGSNVYDVLYNPDYFRSVVGALIIAATAGALFNTIPFFFYDLDEVKQKGMVAVLKVRALFEDFGNKSVSDSALVEAVDLIEECKEYFGKEEVTVSKDRIKAAKKLDYKAADKDKRKELIKTEKANYKQAKLYNEKIKIADFVINELEKFSTPDIINQVVQAQRIVDAGLNGFLNVETVSLKEAKAMPKSTKAEKEIRNTYIDKARAVLDAEKAVRKHYPNGIEEFDFSVFDKLFKLDDEVNEQIKLAYEKYNKNKNKGNKEAIELLKVKRKKISREIKKANDQSNIFSIAAKPYLDAKRLLTQKENYSHYDEIKEEYQGAKQRLLEKQQAEDAQLAKEKAEKEAHIAQVKAQRKEKHNK